MEDLFAAIQPSGDGGAGTPPPNPPTPPAEPSAPVAPAHDQPSAEEKADADEWAKVAEDMFPGLAPADAQKEENDGTTQPAESTETPQAPAEEHQGDGASEAGAEAETQEAEGDNKEDDTPYAADLSARAQARERQQLEQNVKAEIREKMFADMPTELKDADGDPIRSIDDVMKLRNPRTGQAFTEDEAGMWLLTAQQQMRDNIAQINAQVDAIAETGLTMKDESEMIAHDYGALLEAMPELTKDLWEQYSKTLITDPKSQIVLKAPVSLEQFYRTALEPYAALARQLDSQGQTAPATPPTPAAPDPAAAKAATDAARQARRQDRSDIYGGGKVNEVDGEADEWGKAALGAFGEDALRAAGLIK